MQGMTSKCDAWAGGLGRGGTGPVHPEELCGCVALCCPNLDHVHDINIVSLQVHQSNPTLPPLLPQPFLSQQTETAGLVHRYCSDCRSSPVHQHRPVNQPKNEQIDKLPNPKTSLAHWSPAPMGSMEHF